jgi:hypothetical protein
VVYDKKTGNVIAGAYILVLGTTTGDMAGKDGKYMIPNLPAGTYDVQAKMMGYAPYTYQQVQINVDLTTELYFPLEEGVLHSPEIIVTKERELIQSELTSSTYFLSGEDIAERLPVSSYQQAIASLPGMTGEHVHGGRPAEPGQFFPGAGF